MRLTLITIGSRGDVQPYIPLSLGLQRAGHHVRFTTHSNFEDFVTGHGLDFAPLHGDPQAIMASQQGQTWMNDSAIKRLPGTPQVTQAWTCLSLQRTNSQYGIYS